MRLHAPFAIAMLVTMMVALIPVTISATEQQNPFGLMLGAPGMSVEERILLVKELGVTYFRPYDVNTRTENCNECTAARRAGLQLVLTVRNLGGVWNPSHPPNDIESYKLSISRILHHYTPWVLVVENEENSELFYSGTPAQYGVELQAACEVAHSLGRRCASGGLVSGLVALLVYYSYLDSGQSAKAESFAERAFDVSELEQLGSAYALDLVQKGRELLKQYALAGIDYANFHWYIRDPSALQEAVNFLRQKLRLPLITNEIGQQDADPATTLSMMSAVVAAGLPVAVWFSIDAGRARALVNSDGTLRPTGETFKDFMQQHYSIPELPVPVLIAGLSIVVALVVMDIGRRMPRASVCCES